jgi:hypothetical protein
MIMLQLCHVLHGVCAQEVVTVNKPQRKIRHDWKMKYGKKFYECTIEVVDDEYKKIDDVEIMG